MSQRIPLITGSTVRWFALSLLPPLGAGGLSLWLINGTGNHVPLVGVWIMISAVLLLTCLSAIANWLIHGRSLERRINALNQQVLACVQDQPWVLAEDPHNDSLGQLSRSIHTIVSLSAEENQQRQRESRNLSHQATHDELTGLSNRKYGNETIARLDNADSDTPTSILFLDLDGFKQVNDTKGHAVGDEILVAVSLRLKAILHKESIIIRWGGDEFVIVLPGADQRAAISVAQDVADVFKQPIATSDGVHKLGCSIGMSTSRPNTPLDTVLQEADEEMYRQKKRRKADQGQACSPDTDQLDNDLDAAA